MNWSVFSAYVGDVFGSPLAIEGLGAFMLEATFIGLWVFGWNRLSPRVHLATIYLVWAGTWLSAYFILAANSWMQHPVGYEINSADRPRRGERHLRHPLPGVRALRLGARHPRRADHRRLPRARRRVLAPAAGPQRRRSSAARRSSRSSSSLPVSFVQLGVGSEFGVAVTDAQPMKIAATEALWDTEQPAAFSLFQIGGFTEDDQTPSFDDRDPRPALVPRDELVQGPGRRHQRAPGAVRAAVRPGQLHPGCPARLLEHARDGLPRDAAASCSRCGAPGCSGAGGSRAPSGSSARRSSGSRSRSSPTSPAGS